MFTSYVHKLYTHILCHHHLVLKSGRIQDVAGLARTQLPKDMADKLVRHFNAAQIAGYVGLNAIGQGSPYSKAYFFDVYNKKNDLLTPDEMEEINRHDMDNSGLCMKELVTWCQEDVVEARKAGYLDSYQEKLMHDRILAFRAAMDGMYDYTDQPPHFFYIHFLVLLSALYLPLFAIDTAYSAGWGEETYIGLDILNGIIVFLQCIFVVGLRSLGTKMIVSSWRLLGFMCICRVYSSAHDVHISCPFLVSLSHPPFNTGSIW